MDKCKLHNVYKQICPKRVPLEFKVSGVYCISFGEHSYIGSSKNIQQRIAQHRKKLRAHRHQSKFQKYYNIFGESRMCINILEFCEVSQIKVKEKYWIESLEPDINKESVHSTVVLAPIFNGKGSKKVYQYTMEGDFIREFPSVKEASRYLNVDSRGIGLCASDAYIKYKSAYGYRWSYTKVIKLPKYINSSSKAVSRSIIVFDVLTGEEFVFASIAEAVRVLLPNTSNFDSSCAVLCSAANHCGYFESHYLAKNSLDLPYIIPKRNIYIYNSSTKRLYKGIKEASADNGISVWHLRKACKKHTEWLYINQCARVKLCESGKLFIDKDNPNPSLAEMH